jgi:predicted NBD/HSP70 family sugar kinase
MIVTKRSRHDHVIGVNAKVVRDINRSLILNIIRERQPISRAAIAGLSRLNKSTVSSIVAGLLREDLLVEQAAKTTAVGRTPINIRLKTGKHLFGAISFDAGMTKAAIVDIDGTIRFCSDTIADSRDPQEFVIRCTGELTSLRKRHRLPLLKGIGVTVSGIVDSAHSKVVYAPSLGWQNLDLGGMVTRECPDIGVVAVENDAKASALAELWFGHHDINLSNFVFLSVGRGIGTGIVIDRRVLIGESNLAGEFGHMTLVEGGVPCSCGNLGCWEAYASDRATVQRYLLGRNVAPEGGERFTIEDLIAAAGKGDAAARKELLQTGQYLGQGIANIIKSVDPDAIIVGGPITCAWDLIAPVILEGLKQRGFAGKLGNTTILPTSLVGRPSLLGAATLPIRKIFTDVRVTI